MTETEQGTGNPPSEGPEVQTQWVTGEIGKEARMWAMFCHLAGVVGLSPILPGIGSAVAPFVIWQLKADEFPFVAEQGRRAVNFQLSMLLYGVIVSVICLISLVGIPLIPIVFFVVGLVDLIFVLIAAVHVNAGEHYRYPFTIRFFK